MSHFLTKCSCGTVLMQCRCPGLKQETIVDHGCDVCKSLAKNVCPGCAGEGVIPMRFQRMHAGRRQCTVELRTCLICHGTKEATQADFDRFWEKHTHKKESLP